ncbi:MAG: DUF4097 family beta strand repeat-containing protein [Vicinamibacterales bacterium]
MPTTKLILVTTALSVATGLAAQSRDGDRVSMPLVERRAAARPVAWQRDDPCARSWRGSDKETVCESRDSRMPAGALRVDAGGNGSIRVDGEARSDVAVEAIVQASAPTRARAQELAAAVRVETAGGVVRASGPNHADREWWSVSFRLKVPVRNDLELQANNGGIAIGGVEGAIRFATTNGGVTLTDLAGSVQGRTTNGGVHVSLAGSGWSGERLDVATTNGAVSLTIPDPYNAELETSTVNGGVRTDYPLTVRGRLARSGFKTTLGAGGAPIRVVTTNGALRIARRDP